MRRGTRLGEWQRTQSLQRSVKTAHIGLVPLMEVTRVVGDRSEGTQSVLLLENTRLHSALVPNAYTRINLVR